MAAISSERIAKELERAGVVHDLDTIKRVVIDLRAGEPATVYVQRHGRPELAEMLPDLLADAKVVET